ncbi:hypothetical protein V7S79_10505 [Aquirufa sp. ROCK-SH2]
MKKLKITLGILFTLQMLAFGTFAANKSEKIESKKLVNNTSDACCLYWGGTNYLGVIMCGYGDMNCTYAAIAHDFLMKGKIMILTRRKK